MGCVRGAPTRRKLSATAAKAASWAYYRDVANDPAWATSEKGVAARRDIEARLHSFARFAPKFRSGLRTRHPARRIFRAFTRKIFTTRAGLSRTLKAPLLEVIGDKDDVVEPASTIAALERLKSQGGQGHDPRAAGGGPHCSSKAPPARVTRTTIRKPRCDGRAGAPQRGKHALALCTGRQADPRECAIR